MIHSLTARLAARRGTGPIAAALAQAQSIADPNGSVQRVTPVAATRAEADWQAGCRWKSQGCGPPTDSPWTATTLGPSANWASGSGAPVSCPYSRKRPRHLSGCRWRTSTSMAAAAWAAIGCRYEVAGALRAPRPIRPSRTVREREVLELLDRGHTDREITVGRSTSGPTVGHHVAAVLRKTGAGNRRELRRSVD